MNTAQPPANLEPQALALNSQRMTSLRSHLASSGQTLVQDSFFDQILRLPLASQFNDTGSPGAVEPASAQRDLPDDNSADSSSQAGKTENEQADTEDPNHCDDGGLAICAIRTVEEGSKSEPSAVASLVTERETPAGAATAAQAGDPTSAKQPDADGPQTTGADKDSASQKSAAQSDVDETDAGKTDIASKHLQVGQPVADANDAQDSLTPQEVAPDKQTLVAKDRDPSPGPPMATLEAQGTRVSGNAAEKTAEQVTPLQSAAQSDSGLGPQVQVAAPRSEREPNQRHGDQKWFQKTDTNSSSATSEVASPTAGNPTDSDSSAETIYSKANAPGSTVSPEQPSVMADAIAQQPGTAGSSAAPATAAAIPSSVAAASAGGLSADSGLGDMRTASGSTTSVNTPGANASDNRSTAARTTGTSAANKDDAISNQDRVRLIQRISRSFARIGPTGGQMNLKLHPPQLGTLNVQVRMEGRSLAAKLTTESAAARDIIIESLPALRNRLADQGVEVSQFQVEIAENGSDASTGSGTNPDSDTLAEQRWPKQPPAPRQAQPNASPAAPGTAGGESLSPLSNQSLDGIDVQA